RARIETLQRRIGVLENDLADRPSRAEAEELRGLREERTRWEQDRQVLLAEKGRFESRLERLMIEVDKGETLRDRNTALLETHALLKAALDDLQKNVNDLVEKPRNQDVFKEMLHMDGDPELQQAPSRLFPGTDQIDLRDFAADVRHRIGLDPREERPELYYC